MKPVVLSLIGRKGSGKSEVIESLVYLLKSKGLRIGVIKHLANESIEIDQPGKDTFRYRMQGAETVMLAGSKRLAVFSNIAEEPSLEKLLSWFENYDLVLLEGYFLDSVPKIEIWQKALGEPQSKKLQNVIAVYSSDYSGMDLPHFPPHEMTRMISFIEEKLLKVQQNA